MRHDGISVESSWEILILNWIEICVFFSLFIRSIFPQFFRWIIVAIWIVSHNNTNVLKLNRKLQVVRRNTSSVYSKTWWMAQLNAIKINKFSRFREIPKHRIQVKWSKFALNARARMLPTLFHIIITVSRF